MTVTAPPAGGWATGAAGAPAAGARPGARAVLMAAAGVVVALLFLAPT